jgi:DedD protein
MTDRAEELRGEKRRSAHYLILVFFACVAVCAVFFSLGFLVGVNKGPTKTAPVTENVASPSTDIPPTINVPPASPGAPPPVETGSALKAGTASPQASNGQPQGEPAPQEQNTAPETAVSKPARQTSVQQLAVAKKVQPPAPAELTRGRHYAVQVMASRSKADAVRLEKLLRARGYHVVIVPPRGSNGGRALYRVQAGPYKSRAQAESARNKLRREGFKPFVIR